MHKILLSIFFVCGTFILANAQVPGGGSCEDAAPLCTDYVNSFPLQTGTSSQTGPNYGCLSTQPNPVWYFIQVETAGDINMSLTAGSDIDFIIWGPFTDITCDSGDLSATNIVDCSYSPTNNETPSIPNAQVGEVYMFLITNFANTPQNFTLTQTSGTGGTNCDIVDCQADAGDLSFTPDVSACEMDPSLNLNIIPFYPGGGQGPDPAEYSYTFIISDATTGVILSYASPADLSAMAPGDYNVCGFSYLTADAALVPSPDGVLTVTQLADMLFSINAPFCGNVSIYCVNVHIGSAPLPSTMDTTICDGENIQFGNQTLFNSGQYVANLTTPAGCDSMVTLNLTVLPPALLNATETICSGDFVTYNFVNYYSPGIFTILTSNAAGCDSTIYLNLTVLYDYVNVDVIGALDCNSNSVFLDGSNSVMGNSVSYQWYQDGVPMPGQTNFVLTVFDPGDYTLEITNSANGATCTNAETVSIVSAVTDMSIDADAYGSIDCNNPEMVLPINITIASSNFSFFWTASNGGLIIGDPNVEDITVGAAGTYSMTLINLDNSCSITEDFVVMGDFLEPNINAYATNINCISDAQLNGSSNTGGANPSWTGPAVSNPNSWNTTANMPGTYTLTVTSTNGCTSSQSVVVEAYSIEPTASAGTDQELDCLNTSTTLDGSGTSTNPDDVISWVGPGISATNQNDVSPTVNEAGTYILTVTNMLSSCMDTDTVEVNLNAVLPNVMLNADPTLTCQILNVDLISDGSDSGSNYTYTWSGTGVVSGSENDEDISVGASGVYTLTILNTDNNCSNQETVEVLTNQNYPLAEAGDDVIITCANPETNLDGSNSTPGLNYEWSGPSITGDNTILNPEINAPGLYFLSVTDTSNGCITVDSVLSTSLDDIPEAQVQSFDVLTCATQSINLAVDNADVNFNYTWIAPDMNTTTGVDVDVSLPGVYTLNVIDPSNGCPNNMTFEVLQNIEQPNIVPAVDDILTCTTLGVTINAGNTTGQNLDYTWFGPGINVGNQNDENPMVSEPGIYSVTFVDLSNGCSNTSQINIDQNVTPPATIVGDSIVLTCTSAASVATLVDPVLSSEYTYTWIGNGIDANNQDGIDQVFDQEGTYTLTVLNENNGCETVSTLDVIENKNEPNASGIGATLNCNINTVQIQGQSTTQFVQFEWVDPSLNTIVGSSPTVSEPGTYNLVVTGLNGCVNNDVFVDVLTNYNKPNIQSEGGKINCYQSSLDLVGQSSTPDVTYEWMQNNTVVSNENIYTVNTSGMYELVVTGTNGCKDNLEVEVTSDFDQPDFSLLENGQIDCVSDATEVILSMQSTGDYDYTWDGPGNGFNIINNGQGIEVYTAGIYGLNVQDMGNGCANLKMIEIVDNTDEPVAELGVTDITCFGETNGAVTIQQVTGGVAPYSYSLNGAPLSQNPINVGLSAGNYSYQIEDAIGCTWQTNFDVLEPAQNVIEIVPDQGQIDLGDSTILTLQVDNITTIDSVIWTGEISGFISDLSVIVKPTHSTNYEAKLIDNQGCATTAYFYLELDANRDIFVPHAFTPNNDGINDFAFIQSGRQVEQISKFLIVDRWGEIVYENYNFKPNIQQEGWNGYRDGQPMNSAVFLYVVEVDYIDGQSKAFKGDITLIK